MVITYARVRREGRGGNRQRAGPLIDLSAVPHHGPLSRDFGADVVQMADRKYKEAVVRMMKPKQKVQC
jgi:hypothetical protein